MSAAIRINGEALDPERYSLVPEARATSDIRLTPAAWELYDPAKWLQRRRDDEWVAIESKLPPRTLDIEEVRRLFAPLADQAGVVEVELFGALALLYWGHSPEARKPRENDGETPPFATYKQALRFIVEVPARTIGVGPMRLDVAEEKDEHRIARAAARRNNVEHIKASGSHVGTSHVKGEHMWILRHDVMTALAQCGEPVHVRALIHKDIGEWVQLKKGETQLTVGIKLATIAERLGVSSDAAKEVLRKTRSRIENVLVDKGLVAGYASNRRRAT